MNGWMDGCTRRSAAGEAAKRMQRIDRKKQYLQKSVLFDDDAAADGGGVPFSPAGADDFSLSLL
jgi:hypothetical protein